MHTEWQELKRFKYCFSKNNAILYKFKLKKMVGIKKFNLICNYSLKTNLQSGNKKLGGDQFAESGCIDKKESW